MAKYKKILITVFTSFLLLCFSPSPTYAATIFIQDTSSQYVNLYNLYPSYYVITAINILLGASGVLALIFLLIGGIQWITAGSDKDASEKAKRRVTQALVGLAITFSAYSLLYVIRTLFNVDLIQFTISNLGS